MSPLKSQTWQQLLAAIALLITALFSISPAAAQACTSDCLRVYSIELSDLGSSIRGIVKLTDETAAGVSNTTVQAIWTRPDGSTLEQNALVGTRLRAEFRLYTSGIPGTYTLTIVDASKAGYSFDPDNSSLLSESIMVGLPDNQPPVATPNADTTTGPAPLTVNFDATGSSDADGTIVAYAWDFGDGNSSAEPDPANIYWETGTYTATLTVTDDMGATASASIQINATDDAAACTSQCISVDRIRLRYDRKSGLLKGQVRLTDENGQRVTDAVVHGVWTRPDGSKLEQHVDLAADAQAMFSILASEAGTYRLDVADVIKSGHTFDAAASNVLEATTSIKP
ncbi:MAG: PKD domain-containing protein [Gammaproteobacteria bacterium]